MEKNTSFIRSNSKNSNSVGKMGRTGGTHLNHHYYNNANMRTETRYNIHHSHI